MADAAAMRPCAAAAAAATRSVPRAARCSAALRGAPAPQHASPAGWQPRRRGLAAQPGGRRALAPLRAKQSLADQLLDVMEGGPKLRRWYGAEKKAPRDGSEAAQVRRSAGAAAVGVTRARAAPVALTRVRRAGA